MPPPPLAATAAHAHNSGEATQRVKLSACVAEDVIPLLFFHLRVSASGYIQFVTRTTNTIIKRKYATELTPPARCPHWRAEPVRIFRDARSATHDDTDHPGAPAHQTPWARY